MVIWQATLLSHKAVLALSFQAVKVQFSLNTLLFKGVPGSAVMCTAIVALIAVLGRGGVIALIFALVAASCAVCGGWYIEQRVLECPKSVRGFLTLTLLGISIWLITLIHSALWLEVPGAYGPVQYWDEGEEAFMAVRAVAMLVMLVGMLLTVAVLGLTFNAVVVEPPSSAWRQVIVPTFALAVYVLAYRVFVAYGFFPSA
jgi:hypothetical protein